MAQRWSYQIHVGFKFMSREPPPRAVWRTVPQRWQVVSQWEAQMIGFSCLTPGLSLQFLLGWKDDESVLVGGEWSPSLDGLDPKGDPQVLVRTATRCAQAQAGIDLSACTKW